MISVRKIIGDERKYCTHCGDRAYFELNYNNPKIIQQSSNGVLCSKCFSLLKIAVAKATRHDSKSIKSPTERSVV